VVLGSHLILKIADTVKIVSIVVVAVSVNTGVTHHAIRFDFENRAAVKLVGWDFGTCLFVHMAVEHRRLIVAPYCFRM